MPSIPAKKRWVTFAKPVVQGAEQVLEYLGRYVHKTAIGNHAVVASDDQTVTFRYTDSRTHERRQMTLPAFEFMRRFLQHVPPRGFHRVRCFGLLHSQQRETLRRLQLMLAEPRELNDADTTTPATEEPPRLRCPSCGAVALVVGRRLDTAQCRAWSAAMDFHSGKPGLAMARAPPFSAERAA